MLCCFGPFTDSSQMKFPKKFSRGTKNNWTSFITENKLIYVIPLVSFWCVLLHAFLVRKSIHVKLAYAKISIYISFQELPTPPQKFNGWIPKIPSCLKVDAFSKPSCLVLFVKFPGFLLLSLWNISIFWVLEWTFFPIFSQPFRVQHVCFSMSNQQNPSTPSMFLFEKTSHTTLN